MFAGRRQGQRVLRMGSAWVLEGELGWEQVPRRRAELGGEITQTPVTSGCTDECGDGMKRKEVELTERC